MAVKRVEILEVEERKSKSGNMYRVCQCVVHGVDGKKKVGEMMVFNKDIVLSEGNYIIEYDVTVNFDRQVVAEPVRAVPYVDPAQVESFVGSASSAKADKKTA